MVLTNDGFPRPTRQPFSNLGDGFVRVVEQTEQTNAAIVDFSQDRRERQFE